MLNDRPILTFNVWAYHTAKVGKNETRLNTLLQEFNLSSQETASTDAYDIRYRLNYQPTMLERAI